MQLKRTILSI